jgi:hypothetical protein
VNDGHGGSAGITVNVTVNQTYYTVTINRTGTGRIISTPDGVDCGTTCLFTFTSGSEVSLFFEKPAISSGFSGWGGACSGTGACVLNMSSEKIVSAVFIQSPPVKNQTTGVAYNDLQAACSGASSNDTISALGTLPAAGLTLDTAAILTIEGGYDADYSAQTGLTPLLGPVFIKLAPIQVNGLVIKPPATP